MPDRTEESDPIVHSETVREKMERGGCPPSVVDVVERQLAVLRSGSSDYISDAEITPYESPRPSLSRVDPAVADTVAVVRLNGGLGTSMGLDRAKSLLAVKGDSTFMDVIVGQVLALRARFGARVPITFLNSFRTSDDCVRSLARVSAIETDGVPIELMQHRIPKLRADDLSPVRWPAAPELEWCPPGHGDIYTIVHETRFLDRLHELGFRRVFVANADNLGATPDPMMATWFARSGAPFAVEAVRRTENDRKGGHFARRRADGRLVLRETAQTPPDELADIGRHRFASTNNLWFDIASMRDLLSERRGDLRLPVIVNRKTVDPADASSPAVVQLETAMGAAIEVFEGATTVEVGRDRFIPVKTTDDLLLVRSDCYRLAPDHRLVPAAPSLPTVRLGDAYRRIDDFDRRFPFGVPSLVEATSLTIRGDWTFGRGVRIVGDVELGPAGGRIADGTVLEGPRP